MMGKRKLPEGWRWEKIEDHISDYQSGLARGEKSRKEGYPHLRMNNISKNLKLDLTLLWRIPANEGEVRSYCLQKGDILFNNTNSPELVGKSCLFNIDGNEIFLFSNHLTRIRTKRTLDSKYLLFWINALWRRRYFENNCDIWVNQAAVRVEDLLFPTEIPLPPTYDEQVAIVNELERRMAGAEKMRQAVLLQKEMVAAMQGAILREAFPYKEGDKLPEGWKWERIGNLGDLSQGGTPSTHNLDYWNGKIPFITGADVTELYISKARSFLTEKGLNSGKTQQCEKGDLLIVSRTRVGRIGIAATTIGISQDMSVLKAHNGYDVKYFAMYLKSISQRLVESCQGATIKGLTRDYIENIPVLLPPTIDDQMAIANQLERKMAEEEKIRQAVNRQFGTVEALPGAILREAFDFEKQ